MDTRFSAKTTRAARSLAILLAAAAILATNVTSAAPKFGNSLDWVPADAAFYSASLRLKEQIDIVAQSRAWAKLTQLPSVQMAMGFAQIALHQPGGPGDQIQKVLADPENRELLDLVADGFSHEIVVF